MATRMDARKCTYCGAEAMTEPMDVEEVIRQMGQIDRIGIEPGFKDSPLGIKVSAWLPILKAHVARLARDREVVRKVREEMGGWRTESAPENPFTSMGNIYYSRVDGWLALLDSILEPERAKETT